MKKSLFAACIVLPACFTLVLVACTNNAPVQPVKEPEKTEMSQSEMLIRGSNLVTAIGCNHCHTPKKMGPSGPVYDSALLLSGHQANSPLPVIDKKALTPGNWVLFASDLTATVGPWGISYAANLTPDSLTGIGAWSEEIFIKTIRSGKHLGQEGGRPIMPPMPWESVASLNDDDLKSVYTFLHSLPAIKNQVPAYMPPPEVMKLK